MALSAIAPFSNSPEIIGINNKTSRHVADQFTNLRLRGYLKPNRCMSDNGGKLFGHEFQSLLAKNAGFTLQKEDDVHGC